MALIRKPKETKAGCQKPTSTVGPEPNTEYSRGEFCGRSSMAISGISWSTQSLPQTLQCFRPDFCVILEAHYLDFFLDGLENLKK